MDKKKIITYIQKHHMIRPGDSVIAAVSGGADSVALLLLLSELSEELEFSLFAVHVEHGIRGEESLEDMRFTEELCGKLGIPLRICHVDAPSFAEKNGIGLEEAARELRYAMLEEAAAALREFRREENHLTPWEREVTLKFGGTDLKTESKKGKAGSQKSKGENREEICREEADPPCTIKIALAHHMQDQAETVLFRLARGTGMNGLAGMQPVRQNVISETRFAYQSNASEIQTAHQDGGSATQPVRQSTCSCTYIRPLLATSRGKIEEYLSSRGQEYCVDSTNLDESYARNRIRSRVLPELVSVNAQAAAHIAQAAEQAAEMNDYIAGEAARELERISTEENTGRISIEIPELLCLHPALQKELLRQALIRIAGHEKDLTAGHVAQLMELAGKSSGREISLPYEVMAVREFDRLCLCKEQSRRTAVTHTGSFEISPEQLEKLKETGEELRIRISDSEEVVLKIFEFPELRSGNENTTDQNKRLAVAEKSLTVTEKGLTVAGIETEVMDTGVKDVHEKPEITGESADALGKCSKTISGREENVIRKVFAYENLKDGFTIRHRQPGDYMYLKNGHHRKLKQYLIDEKIPVSHRPKLWLLARGSQVLWLIGGRVNDFPLTDRSEKNLISIEYRGDTI